MLTVNLTANELVAGLMALPHVEQVSILDSCGTGSLGSHLLIAGISPLDTLSLSHSDPEKSLSKFDSLLTNHNVATIFTISYDFGAKLQAIGEFPQESDEPDIFAIEYRNLIVHDYSTGITRIEGDPKYAPGIVSKITKASRSAQKAPQIREKNTAQSNFTQKQYLERIKVIQDQIRLGNTYQTNLTQQFTVKLNSKTTSHDVFRRLRKDHGAAYAAFIKRNSDTVVSISPERFIRIEEEKDGRTITSSPIKGTRKRGATGEQDKILKDDLNTSKKDRAENTMIVDLIRNDLGRICDFGTVEVEKLCEIEEHPTLFHLVSTVSGTLRSDVLPSDILRAVFPCGSITGCPKISTMKLINKLETAPRGLSMGAIGYSGFDGQLEMNVAIRTMVVDQDSAVFNVGGGIVIDSDPEDEYLESMLKARALFDALGVEI